MAQGFFTEGSNKHAPHSSAAIFPGAHSSLTFLSKNQNTHLWILMNKFGCKKQEPANLDIAPENPVLLKRVIDLHLDEFHYS